MAASVMFMLSVPPTKSCRDVQAVIDLVKPQVVFVELCRSRALIVEEDVVKDELESEFVVAFGKPRNMEPRLYSVIDLLILHRRILAKMPLWHMTRLWYHSFKENGLLRHLEPPAKQLKEWDDCDVSSANSKLFKMFPTMEETILHERDQYMSATLLEVARKHNSVVAVVGAAHLPGIQKNWKQPIDIERLLEMPPGKTVLLKKRRSFIIFNMIITTILVTMIAIIHLEIYLLQRVTRDDDNGVDD